MIGDELRCQRDRGKQPERSLCCTCTMSKVYVLPVAGYASRYLSTLRSLLS